MDLDDAPYILARSGGLGGGAEGRPPVFKFVGIALAVASGLFIGVSFVLKKVGLLKANVKYNEEAGEGYGYLKNVYWWGGMTLMILGEICNFVAYAFVDAILVTPLGALSVVVTTVLSAIFLKERLSFVGKVGCINCIIGSVVIALNAPQQSSVSNIQDMKHYVIQPGFLAYAGVIIVGCAFVALWAGPRYGKKSMFVYLTICSLIGGLSVVATQGLGAAIIAQISGKSQFKEWFLYVLLVFVIATLLTEIIYLNKALNLFNAALVTPTYYVIFTSATIITSAVLFQGFKGSPVTITTVVLGFLVICSGVVLLQLSKSAKDVPDTAIFKGDLDQVREVAEQEQPESEPKADAIRGTAAIIRRLSTPRRHMEQNEIRRYQYEKSLDMKDPDENEIIEWDGLRRRRTIVGQGRPTTAPQRTKTLHPPLGMSKFPDFKDDPIGSRDRGSSFLSDVRSRTSSRLRSKSNLAHVPEGTEMGAVTDQPEKTVRGDANNPNAGLLGPFQYESRRLRGGTMDSDARRNLHSPQSSPPPSPPAHRQFSFGGIFQRKATPTRVENTGDTSPKRGPGFFNLPSFTSHHQPKHQSPEQKLAMRDATEEEALGLVKGDSIQQKPDRSRTPSPTPSTLEFMAEPSSYKDTAGPSSQPRRSSSDSSSYEYQPHLHRVPSFDEGGDDERYVSHNRTGSSAQQIRWAPGNFESSRSLTSQPPPPYTSESPVSQSPPTQGRALPSVPSSSTPSRHSRHIHTPSTSSTSSDEAQGKQTQTRYRRDDPPDPSSGAGRGHAFI